MYLLSDHEDQTWKIHRLDLAEVVVNFVIEITVGFDNGGVVTLDNLKVTQGICISTKKPACKI